MSETFISKPLVLAALARHIGEANGIHIGQLTREIVQGLSDKNHERHVRARIEELRHEGHHICATPKSGYFMAETEAELEATCGFLYDRAITSLRQVAAMKKVSLPDLAGQLHLKT